MGLFKKKEDDSQLVYDRNNSSASLLTIVDNIGVGIFVKDLESGKLLFTNQNFKRNFIREIEENQLDDMLNQAKPMDPEGKCYELYHDRRQRWYDLQYSDIIWYDGTTVTLGVVYDVTDRIRYEKQKEREAYYDQLTGVYNRRRCEEDLEKAIADARGKGVKGYIAYMDLNNYRAINEALGHHYGDILMKEIVRKIKNISYLRHNIYRLGGDEFLFIIKPEDAGNLRLIAESLKDVFELPYELNQNPYICSMNLGVVSYPTENCDIMSYIRVAEEAMQKARNRGENEIYIWE